MGKKKDYDQRTDLEKIAAQWTKLSGLHSREEWSAAVVRAATAAELAANLAIRHEFSTRSQFDPVFVDSLLLWANGLSGKLNKLLLPVLQGQKKHDAVKELCGLANKINKKRNGVAHQGMFCSETEATKLIEDCKRFVERLVQHYEPGFDLCEEIPAQGRHPSWRFSAPNANES